MDFLFNTISVSDIEKSMQFYTEILNLNLSRRFQPRPGVEIVFLEDEKVSCVELIEHEDQETPNNKKESKIKMGFEVKNLNDTIDFLKTKNIKIQEGPVKIKDGRFINIQDPDGVMIGLYEFN